MPVEKCSLGRSPVSSSAAGMGFDAGEAAGERHDGARDDPPQLVQFGIELRELILQSA